MATYSFVVKKGKYVLELSTSDRELLVSQFEAWVRQAGEYARQQKIKGHKDVINSQIKDEEKITEQNIEAQINSYQSTPETIEPEVIPEPEKAPEKEPDGEPERESVKENLDIFYAPPTPREPVRDNTEDDSKAHGVFDDILENTVNNPQTELSFKTSPSIKKDTAFLNYMNSRKIERRIDYLLLTAYYFTQFEQMPRFTLKQLNAKLMQNLAVIIDHAVLQEAINRDYIECLPDLTGLVGASEYRLTAYGEKTLLDE